MAPEDSSWCQMRTKTLADSERVSRYCNGCVPVQRLYDSARLKWRLNIYPFFCKFCAIIAAVGSGMILWSEMTMAFSSMDSPVGTFLNHLADNGAGVFMVQFFSFLALSYMSICTYWAMFRINLGWAFTLQPNQQSPSTSLLFNATYFCRLQFSLAFNFLLLLNNDGR